MGNLGKGLWQPGPLLIQSEMCWRAVASLRGHTGHPPGWVAEMQSTVRFSSTGGGTPLGVTHSDHCCPDGHHDGD